MLNCSNAKLVVHEEAAVIGRGALERSDLSPPLLAPRSGYACCLPLIQQSPGFALVGRGMRQVLASGTRGG